MDPAYETGRIVGRIVGTLLIVAIITGIVLLIRYSIKKNKKEK